MEAPRARRAKVEAATVLDVNLWLHTNPPAACKDVRVSQPVHLGGWSKRGEEFVHGDGSGLLPYTPPSLPADLDAGGAGSYVPKPAGEACGVETVLAAVAAATASGVETSACDVVTFRNNLNKIFGTALEPQKNWAVDACLLGGRLILDIVKLPEGWTLDPADQERFVRWGYRFEALCTGQAVADSTSEYGALLRARVGPHTILLGAEIDCYDPQQQGGGTAAAAGSGAPGLGSWIELKTYRMPQHPGQERTLYAFKYPRWWLQSFLAGVPLLALGGRDDQGLVQRIDLVRTAELPRRSAQAGANWSPQQALCFGVDCLAWMRDVAAHHPGQQLRFSYSGGAPQQRVVTSYLVAEGDLPARLATCLPSHQQSAGGGGSSSKEGLTGAQLAQQQH